MPAKDQPLVSIVIPCYNLGQYLDDAVSSVKSQSYRNWELIIVDDGSTEKETQDAVDRIAAANPNFVVIRQKNAGLSEARNSGVKKANGSLVVCLDADDMLDSHYLSKTVPIMVADAKKELGFVTTYLKEFGDRSDLWETSGYNVPQLLTGNRVHAGSMFRKEAWQKANGYKKAMKGGYEDWEFWLSIAEHGYKWDVVREPLFRYRIRANSMLAGAKSKHRMLYERLVDFHPALFAKYQKEVFLDTAEVMQGLRQEIATMHTEIEEKAALIAEYSIKAAKYDDLHKTRIMLYAMKLVRMSIFLRSIPSYGPRAVNKVRYAIPAPVRRAAIKAKRTVLPIKTVTVENEAWPKKQPLVTIVTPFFNSGPTIMETVNSVLDQTYQHFEYFIVDDGSDKEHADVLDKIKDDRIKVIHHKENIGKGSPAAARNDGIKRSSGKYVICLDADDFIDPTYIEKAVAVLETHPQLGLVTTYTQAFGATNETWSYADYNARELIRNNMIITAAMFRKSAWERVGGYKTGIGYEDWEYWINLAEHGYFGKTIPEALFHYRTAANSRYVEDKKKHDDNVRAIHALHPAYKQSVKEFLKKNKRTDFVVSAQTAYANLSRSESYKVSGGKPNVLIAIPWMPFGGAEALICNFGMGAKKEFNISFATGLESKHEWEYKFREISTDIFHLANMFDKESMYLDFLSNYITTRNIDILHIIHTSYVFDMLQEIKRRHPDLKVVTTIFNDRAHFNESIEVGKHIDAFSTDNSMLAHKFEQRLDAVNPGVPVHVIPNGIDCYDQFDPALFDRHKERVSLGIAPEELAILFVGRLSEEKNPDVYLQAAKQLLRKHKSKRLKFFMIGDGPMRPEIDRMLADIDSEQVVYLGYQPSEQVARAMVAADMFVLPSATEGFPLTILEAMSMKTVVVASNVGAVGDVISNREDGYIITPGSADEIVEAIGDALKSQSRLNAMKELARTKVEAKYTVTDLGNNYIQLYKSVL
jgi:glycosyltransferase involved in cell wall biosynthesis